MVSCQSKEIWRCTEVGFDFVALWNDMRRDVAQWKCEAKDQENEIIEDQNMKREGRRDLTLYKGRRDLTLHGGGIS